jgi:beta-barrel assembly-enhancing protease
LVTATQVARPALANWYGVEKQVALGRHYGQQVEATIKLIQDPVITEYVNRVGQNIGRNSDAQVPFTIKVIDSDEINAFALPGGYYVNSGLILAADEEAELGDVMAHEISHVAACHAARENTRGNLLSLASIPLILVGGPIGYAGCQAAGLALPVTFLHSSRAFEAEADYLGLQYVCKSGYDPNAFISFFEKVQAEEKKKPGALAKAFSPRIRRTPDRIEKSQQEIAQILPTRTEYVVSTCEFDAVKERLAVLENRHRVVDPEERKEPTLRRASSGGDKSSQDSKNDDGRPTLKRRDDEN